MGYGSVNVPGVSGPELLAVKQISESALTKSNSALEELESIESLLGDGVIDQFASITGRVTAAEAKIATLWDAVFTNITGNPFTVVLSSLDGVTVTAGVWNAAQSRLEC